MTYNTQPTNGDEAFKHIKAGLILQDTTVTAWCRDNGYFVPNLKAALCGSWKGEKASKLVAKACKAAGVEYQVAA